jgi:4-amino-4-deoxy-L-arabinose transferase-like glycosyltransferase
MNVRLKDRWLLFLILLLGLGLRLWGISWGFPRIDLNPDELNVFEISSRLTLRDLNPHFFSYSGLTFYLNYFSTHLLSLLHFNMDPVHQMLVHRLWSVFWGTLTIPLCYWSARELFKSKKAAIIAAAFMAVIPLHIWDSHFGTTDIGLAFWTTCAFWLSIKAYHKASAKYYFLAGTVIGLAMGVKFNGALAAISLIGAVLLTIRERRLSWPKAFQYLVLAFFGVVIAFFMASPYTFLDYHHSIAAFFTEFTHSTKSGHFGFDLTAQGWQYHPYVYQLLAAFPFSLGFLLWLATLTGLFFFIYKANLTLKILGLSFVSLYFLILGHWKFVPIRYYLPILPVLIIITAYNFSQLLEKSPRWGTIFLTLVFAYTLVFSVTSTDRFRHDTRLEAAAWAAGNLKAGSTFFFVAPHFGFSYSPGLDDKIFNHISISLGDLKTRIMDYSLPDNCFLCLSSLDYDRDYRKKKDLKSIQVWESIRNQPELFEKIKSFQGWFINKSLYTRLDPMFAGYFVSPTIEFYQYHARGIHKRS